MSSRTITESDFDFSHTPQFFPTKKDAQRMAVDTGWGSYSVLRVKRRFETVWMVGQWFLEGKRLSPDVPEITFDYILFPLLAVKRRRHESKRGTLFQSV